MKRPCGFWIGLAALAALAGCSQPGSSVQTPVSIESLPKVRAELEDEWRDARRVPSGVGCVAELGLLSEGAALRIGVLPGAAPITAVVQVGETIAHEVETDAQRHWFDWRFDMAAHEGACRVSLTSPSAFHVSTCELVAPADAPPNVLIYLIDTLRLDHLGCYGYEKDVSPNIDAFAQDAVRFTHLTPQSSWTRPSVASLLTSTYPGVHGAEDRPDMLRPGLPSLASDLGAAGYETQGFMSNVNCVPVWGFGHDFMRYADVVKGDWAHVMDETVIDAVLPALDNAAGRPWFFYVHTMAPHEPYDPPEPYAQRFVAPIAEDADEAAQREHTRQRYDGEIAYADAQFGRLMDALKAQGLYDNTYVILLSDHGEEFWEHGGITHGRTLFEEQLRVPLLIKTPGNTHGGAVREQLVEMVDVAPTVLDAVGASSDPRFQGLSFLPHLAGAEITPRAGFASLKLESRVMRSSKTTRLKYIHEPDGNRRTWYDLVDDPGEVKPIATAPPAGEALAFHADRMAARGGSGLHILVTNDGATRRNVSGTVKAAHIGGHEVRYVDELTEITANGGLLSFRFGMPSLAETGNVPARWRKVRDGDDMLQYFDGLYEYPQDSAHLCVDVAPDEPVTIQLQCDEEPLDAAHLFLRELDGERTLPDTPLAPIDLLAGPDAFDPGRLPRRFAVYVWYVPPPEALEADELTPQMREALETLGYL
ncbi:MAG: sulfatase [bacterium]|nr:sulfatase [bacterium]